MKVLDKRIGDTEYIKYRVNIPKKIAEDSGFLNKDIKIKLEKDRIVIEEE
tara:strand:+ start:84 stop:233 length:150 start_codon:yes stop_codon:yes gene_type:complete